MGINVVRPVIDKINSLFLEDGGDYTAHAQAYMSARVLNPLVAKEMDWRAMHDAVSELRSFGFLAFNGTFMSALQREIPSYRAAIQATGDSFWNDVEGAAEYEDWLKKQKEEDPDKYPADATWKTDHIEIETARRVWKWWQANQHKFSFFQTAARLVALVPVTSASVERVFSQVKLIVETVGENALQETIETRLMERVNEY